MTEEFHNFEMDGNLLLNVIKRQAGSLHKAVLEGVMNGIEAGASAINMRYNPDKGHGQLIISDNGRGIADEHEVERWFKRFGTEHDSTENKIWAEFRMGRGQLFAFGVNRWRTATFEFIIDIKQWGTRFKWRKNLKHVDGCHITIDLYEHLRYGSPQSFYDNVKEQIEFMSIPILMNGEQINRPPADLNWDVEDDNAYYSFGQGSYLTIYNMGAFVKRIPASVAGCVGIVVSKQRLMVNFARNDVLSDCEVYQGINEVVRNNRVKRTRQTRRRFREHEKIAALRDLRDGIQHYGDLRNIALIELANGRSVTRAMARSRGWRMDSRIRIRRCPTISGPK